MPIEAFIAILGFILGITLLVFYSDKAVEHSIKIATTLGLSPFIVGMVLVSIGTDLPEIANSIISSAAGHGNINVGDSLGSVLTQITLVFGIIALLSKEFRLKRKEVIVPGFFLILALILSVSIVQQGYISRFNTLLLLTSWPVFMLFTGKLTETEAKKRFVYQYKPKIREDLIIAILGFVGVAIGAYLLIQSIIQLSTIFNVSEYLISFFMVSIGTSLPELLVDLAAIRKKEFELAIGDIIGSCIVDATLSIGIGNLIFPNYISGELAMITGSYAIFASIIVITTLALRKKLDRNIGKFFIFVYLFSYMLLSI
jgi:cation:H+ antiporter